MKLIIVGPGRAGGSIALAAGRAGNEVVGVLGRSASEGYGPILESGQIFPTADVVLLCVRDPDMAEVVEAIGPILGNVSVVAHVSGFLPTSVLAPLVGSGRSAGGFHPLQTLPNALVGAGALAGSYAGIDGDELAFDTLTHLALSMDMKPFRLSDDVRPTYHAAAAAAANFVVTALATSSDLFAAAGIDPGVSRPLVESVVRNVFGSSPREALTGPIARGDTETVVGHLVAAHEVSEALGRQFRLLAEATAILAEKEDAVLKWR